MVALISRVCDEFHTLPSVACRELGITHLTTDTDLPLIITEFRSYQQARHAIDSTDDLTKLPSNPMIDFVLTLLAEDRRPSWRR